MLIDKINNFAKLLESDLIHGLIKSNMACDANIIGCKVFVRPGNKYIKVDVGGSGRYMVDADGNIFGIKAYGVIHKGHRYGTVDTIDNYFWGNYYGYVKRNDKHPAQILSVDEVIANRKGQSKPSNIIYFDFTNKRAI